MYLIISCPVHVVVAAVKPSAKAHPPTLPPSHTHTHTHEPTHFVCFSISVWLRLFVAGNGDYICEPGFILVHFRSFCRELAGCVLLLLKVFKGQVMVSPSDGVVETSVTGEIASV